MPWLIGLRALLYMFVVGGSWLVVLPAILLFLENGRFVLPLRHTPWLISGLIILSAGVLLALVAGYYLITRGRGTPLPLDPTQKLVTAGPYAYVRNPQGIAMTLMVLGELLILRSRTLWLLLPLTLVYLEWLVGSYEERQLLKQHGEQYIRYRQKIRKWRPSLHPYDS